MKNTTKICIVLALFLIIIGSLNASNRQKISLTYLYGDYDYLSLIERNTDAVNVVSPSYFDIDESGNLKVNNIDIDLINKMHENGIKVIPFLSNHWNRSAGRNALNNSNKLVDDVISAIKKYNLDGVNIDLENLTEQEREKYVSFVKRIYEKMPQDKTISVAVAANPRGIDSGWQGSYDYSKLAKYADFILLMAYDEHYEGGELGAVAGIDFVKSSIEYALSKVDKNKIVLGVPFYGRYWKEGESTRWTGSYN